MRDAPVTWLVVALAIEACTIERSRTVVSVSPMQIVVTGWVITTMTDEHLPVVESKS